MRFHVLSDNAFKDFLEALLLYSWPSHWTTTQLQASDLIRLCGQLNSISGSVKIQITARQIGPLMLKLHASQLGRTSCHLGRESFEDLQNNRTNKNVEGKFDR